MFNFFKKEKIVVCTDSEAIKRLDRQNEINLKLHERITTLEKTLKSLLETLLDDTECDCKDCVKVEASEIMVATFDDKPFTQPKKKVIAKKAVKQVVKKAPTKKVTVKKTTNKK